MKPADTVFVIPTYRLRDVAETIEIYDQHIWSNGHSTKMMVFDDSSLANHDKYYSALEKTKTHNEVFYIGPKEKEEFLSFLQGKLRDNKLQSIVRNLFRPSYGGNRNFTLIYTLGAYMVSSDDDMRPYGLMEMNSPSLDEHEISRGLLMKPDRKGYVQKSFDLISSFQDVLGKRLVEIPSNYAQGELLEDSATDLETNTTETFLAENTLRLRQGKVPPQTVVKMAQTFRTGTNDIDALDFVRLYLRDGTQSQSNLHEFNEQYVLANFRPVVTNKNWRMDCGVAAYDNRVGLPPFFPTRLRFEDYLYRLWIQQRGIVSAHVPAVQTHVKNNYMRNPLAMDVFNEEICILLKKKFKQTLRKTEDLSITFDYNGEVTSADTEEILEKITDIYRQVMKESGAGRSRKRSESLRLFAENLKRSFYGFEPDFFQQNVSRIVDDVVSQIRSSLELWPTLVEMCYFYKDKKAFPHRKVRNQRIKLKFSPVGA